MTDERTTSWFEPGREPPPDTPASELIQAAYRGQFDRVRDSIEKGADVNFIDPATGLSALHIAVGTNDLKLCRYLIDECSATIGPDASGRWPTLIAAQCRVDDEMSDYIVEKEAAILSQHNA